MAQFEQRESGGWQARIRRRGFPAKSKMFATRKEAEAWARAIETGMDRGVLLTATEAERTTFSELLKDFKKDFAPKHYRQREDKKEAWRFQADRLEEFFGEYSLLAIDQKLIGQFRDERLQPPAGSKRAAVGESTVRKELFLLSKIFGFAQKDCGIQLPRGNPVEHVRKPADGKARDRRLVPEEWAKLEAECKKSRNKFLYPALLFSVETAMRQGEMLNLDWADVDKKNGIAMLRETKNGEVRAAPLSAGAIAALGKLPRAIRGPVFSVERLTLYHAFAAAVERAGIKDYTWHDLRHEALSRLAERGDLSLLELASISGHKTLQMLKRYTHLQAGELAKKLSSVRAAG